MRHGQSVRLFLDYRSSTLPGRLLLAAGNGSIGPCGHAIVVAFVSLDVIAKLVSAMFVVVDCPAYDNMSGAETIRDSVLS